jgi:ABC-type multidrug transport system ATPase subunit/ABC-type multidrug transport system permease subunit
MLESEKELEQGIPLEEVARPPDQPDEPQEPQVDVEKGIETFQQTEKDLRDILNAAEAEAQFAQGFDLGAFLESSVDAQEKHGIKQKKMGVVFKNLTVVGEGADATQIPNLWTPIEAALQTINPLNWFKKQSKGTDFDILHNITGFCKDGEMLLVLGRPGAGCSTFLRVVANQRDSYKAVSGEVKYGGIQAKEFERFAGETIYTAEEDVHFPTLTVRQTLTAALKCKAPAKRANNQTRTMFMDRVMNMLLQIFGLTKQIDTLVGNEWIRGLSGGERKRLTIAEAMTARAAINCWDCTTRGLDAASALDYTKSLRIMSNTLHRTTIASFYQASEDMYNIFDKVMVLDKGVCVYFGPGNKAKAYFEELGFQCEKRKSTPDFLTGITNPNERKIKPGYENLIPKTAAEMERRYQSSPIREEMDQELADYEAFVEREQPHKDFLQSVLDAKARGTRESSVYITNFWQQTKTMLVREFQLISGDKGAIFGKVFSVLSKAFIYATAYLLLDLDSAGAFSRGGAIFISVLFNSLISLSELPNALRGRRVLQKHKSYAMYHPSAYHIATVATDIPITLLQVTLFSLCAYFLFGLQTDAGKFFIFLFTLFLVSVTMTEFFRFCGNITSSYFAASQLANICLVLLLLYSGFLIPFTQMHPWFSWIYWANPMAYAFKGIFSSEMKGLIFPCKGDGAVPFGPGYTDDTYRACTIAGHHPGEALEVRGEDYLKSYYNYDTSQMSIDIVAVFLFWLLYIVLNCIAMELYDLQAGGYTRQVFKRGKAPKQNDANAVVQQADLDLEIGKSKGSLDPKKTTTFTWKDVNYTVPVKGGSRLLLDKVEGWIKPGQMTALMGSSGAGKTTLLDVLAKRKTIGTIEGTILLNGEPLQIDFERLTGYVEQMDVANPSITVREALRFSARMRQDPSISIEEKYEYVEKVLAMMEMTHLGDALIGDLESGLGISVEERKRLTIGMELVGKPEILFLDEPTSGLDAQSSYNIVKFIRKLADAGMPLVCTIHQPSSVLFEYFDRLLLLARGGKTVYFGDIGPNSRVMLDYFERNGAPKCEDDENPAEYILRAIGAGVNSKVTQDWALTWKNSAESHSVQEELAQIQKEGQGSGANHTHRREFATSEKYQFLEVYKRMNLVWWRNPTYNYGRFILAVIISLIDGFSFWKLSDSYRDLQSRVFAIFSVLIMGNSLIILAQPMFMRQRQYFRREYASKFYGWWQFATSMILVELPYLAIGSGIFILLFYWTSHLESTAINGFYIFIAFVAFMFFAVSFGQVVASFCGSVAQAAVLNPFFTPFLILFAGVLVPPNTMPGFWKSWMYPLDPYHYFLEGVVTTVLSPVSVHCKQNELIQINLNPTFATCNDYMQDFFSFGAPGYIDNPNATDVCGYCPFSNGEQFYSQFDWSNGHRWRNYGILWGYFAFNIGLVILFVYLFRKPKR